MPARQFKLVDRSVHTYMEPENSLLKQIRVFFSCGIAQFYRGMLTNNIIAIYGFNDGV